MVFIAIDAPALNVKDAETLRENTQNAVNAANPFPAHKLRLLLSPTTGTVNYTDLKRFGQTKGSNGFDWDIISLLVRLKPIASSGKLESLLHSHAPICDITYTSESKPGTDLWSTLVGHLTGELHRIFTYERDALSKSLPASFAYKSGSKYSAELLEDEPARMTNSFNHAPNYHLTFSLFTPTFKPSTWEIEQALKEHIYPLLDSFAAISKFTVDSQVQLYAKFSPQIREPEYDPSKKAWTLRNEDLSGFVNAAEWPLSPSIGMGPTINFVLYVPPENQAPLVLQGNGGNSWLIPQWGGVLIHNPPSEKSSPVPTSLDKETLKPAMQKFAQQLFSLLDLPDSFEPLSLRLSTMSKLRTASLLVSASSTLGALARLTEAQPSIVVPDGVAKSVDITISQLQDTCRHMKNGKHDKALESARLAEAEAERAFFDPSMVGQVYFPEEHKIAVYLPLLGPMAVPLVLAALKELRQVPKLRQTND